MHKVSYVLAERFSHDPLETYFSRQLLSGAWKDNLPLYDFGYATLFETKQHSGQLVTGSVKDEM